MTRRTLASLLWTALTLSSATTAVHAQLTPRGPVVTGATPNAAPVTRQSMRASKFAKPIVLQPAPFLTLITLLPNQSEDGWTPVTAGQPKGGASVAMLGNGQSWLVVRASDDTLYGAPIDPASPSSVAATSWRNLGVAALSEPVCAGATGNEFKDDALCTYLTSGGAAAVSWITLDSSPAAYKLPMGGANAGARPTLVPNVDGFYVPTGKGSDGLVQIGHPVIATTLAVWDGAGAIFAGKLRFGLGGGMGGSYVGTFNDYPEGTTIWQKQDGATGPVGCAYVPAKGARCAMAVGGAIRVGSGTTASGSGPINTADLPGGTSPGIAPALTVTQSGKMIVVARNAAGAIFWSVSSGSAFGPWRAANGYAKAGSGISCVTIGEAPTCYIQGGDGRIYARNLGTAVGL